MKSTRRNCSQWLKIWSIEDKDLMQIEKEGYDMFSCAVRCCQEVKGADSEGNWV